MKENDKKKNMRELYKAAQKGWKGKKVSIIVSEDNQRVNSPKYTVVFQSINLQLATKLSPKLYVLVSYFYSKCWKSNILDISIEQISRDFSTKDRNVIDWIRSLKKMNIILKAGDMILLNPELAWSGSLGGWQAAMQELGIDQRITIVSRKMNAVINESRKPKKKEDESEQQDDSAYNNSIVNPDKKQSSL